MSRIIKFRAWDKVAKKYIYNEDNYPFDVKSEGYTREGHRYPYDMDEWYPMCEMHQLNAIQRIQEDYRYSIVIEQFTGLKDKNGVEIYEGDLVRYVRTDIIKNYVRYCIEGCCFLFGDNEIGDNLTEIEVIGNIHGVKNE